MAGNGIIVSCGPLTDDMQMGSNQRLSWLKSTLGFYGRHKKLKDTHFDPDIISNLLF